MNIKLRPLQELIVDGENNPVTLDVAYSVKGDALQETMEEIRRDCGPRVYILPLSAASGGGGIFQVKGPGDGPVVGLQFTPTQQPRISNGPVSNITEMSLDQIIIDSGARQVCAGGAITLDQLSRAISEELGSGYKIPGADLTSYTYAQVGATFMTGGMGPQRRYFSDSVSEIALYDAERLISIAGDSLTGYAGTYGWSGLVTAVRCSYLRFPKHEIAFALPVSNTAENLARLLEHFSPHAYLRQQDGKVVSSNHATDLILGLEHISAGSMQPFLDSGENALTKRARQLLENCEDADADGLVFVSGYSDSSTDEFLLKLVDDHSSDEYTIAGMGLEFTEIFNDPEQMRAIREGIPAAARAQHLEGRFVYKGHTDANITLHPDKVESTMFDLWRANQHYVAAVEKSLASKPGVNGDVLVYGHLNPAGVDPHNRITFACDDENLFRQMRLSIHSHRNEFFHTLRGICESSGSIFVGGEKSAGSEHEMFTAFGTPDQAPVALKAKFNQQSAVVRAAAPMFNWRAMAPYV